MCNICYKLHIYGNTAYVGCRSAIMEIKFFSIDKLVMQLQEPHHFENYEIILKIANTIAQVPITQERAVMIHLLPEWVRHEEPILDLLNSLCDDEQASLVWWSFIESNSILLWNYISTKAKILCVYRVGKECDNSYRFLQEISKLQSIKPETNKLVRCVLKLLWAKNNSDKSNAVFRQIDQLLTEYVIELANNSNELLDLDCLLPYCKPKNVKYCEGILWNNKENSAYCPRVKKPCLISNIKKENIASSGLYGARLYADNLQDWRDWSLLELFKEVKIVPSLPKLKRPEDYLPKLSGWINRINEIKLRLKCSVCGEIMPHNIEYAKFIAKFRVTVFSCKHSNRHDHNIYLNECWGCEEIIDSRESKYKLPGDSYYICIHCGSGPRKSKSYSQGDICPKCNKPEMVINQANEQYYQCLSCSHTIKLPNRRKSTTLSSLSLKNSTVSARYRD